MQPLRWLEPERKQETSWSGRDWPGEERRLLPGALSHPGPPGASLSHLHFQTPAVVSQVSRRAVKSVRCRQVAQFTEPRQWGREKAETMGRHVLY